MHSLHVAQGRIFGTPSEVRTHYCHNCSSKTRLLTIIPPRGAHINPRIWEGILDNILTDKEKTGGNVEVVLQKDAKNIMNAARKQRKYFVENETKKTLRIRNPQFKFI